jgi:hypothetical protein
VVGKYGTVVPLHLSGNGFKNAFGQHVPGLNDIFGPTGHALGDYLRATLLIPASRSYTPGEKSMSYRISRTGYDVLSTAYGDTSSSLDRLVARHAEELSTKVFEYRDASERLWHPLQNLPRAEKPKFWAAHGLPYDYDIVACAPTILFNLAKQAELPKVLLEPLQSYLDDRSGFRQHVAALTGLDYEDAKRLVNSLFNGAKLGANPFWASFKLLEYDHEAMERLKQDTQVKRLRRGIASVWKTIEGQKRADTRLTLDELVTGYERPEWKLKKSTDKWAVYFKYERAVLDSISSYLHGRQINFFSEHDGFRTSHEVDITDLEKHVFEQTGIDLKIEKKSE